MIYRLFSLLVFVFLTSCTEKQKVLCDKSTSVVAETELVLDSFNIPPVLLDERKLIANEDYLISMAYNSDTIFRLFDLKDLSYAGGFGTRGRGPKDFNLANFSTLNPSKFGCYVGDLRTLNEIEIPTGGGISDKNIKFKSQYSIPADLSPLNNAFLINDTLICGKRMTNSVKELVCFNPLNGNKSNLFDYPETNFEVPKKMIPQLFQKNVSFSFDKTKIVFAYQCFPVIRIYT